MGGCTQIVKKMLIFKNAEAVESKIENQEGKHSSYGKKEQIRQTSLCIGKSFRNEWNPETSAPLKPKIDCVIKDIHLTKKKYQKTAP